MNILTTYDKEMILSLVQMELEVIEKGFQISEFMGKIFLTNAINEFKNVYLKQKYGNIIPSMSTEYRFFIIHILKNIKDEYRGLAVKEVISPTIGEFETEDLLKAIKS